MNSQDAVPVPQNPDLEAALLGGMIVDPPQVKMLSGYLDEDDFFVHRHRWVYSALGALDKRGAVAVDMLINELEQRGHLAELGGAAYITKLVSRAAPAYQMEAYADEIRNDATRRRMLKAANTIAQAAYAEDDSIETSLADMHQAVLAVEERAAGEKGVVTASEAVAERYDNVIEGKGDSPRRLMTWIEALDDITGGFGEDDFVIVAGRPGMGKSANLLSGAANNTQRGIPGAFFSLEMPRGQLADRLVAMGGVDLSHIERKNLTPDETNKYTALAFEIIDGWGGNLVIDDHPYMTPEMYRGKVARYVSND
jgi:replicative DNA helicase